MKKNIKIVYFIETLILLFIIIFKIFWLKKYDSNIVNSIFFVSLALLALIILRFPRDKNYYRPGTIRLVLISLLSYYLIIYGMGFFIGFSKMPFAHSFHAIMINTGFLLLIVIAKEIIRFLVCKNSVNNKIPVILLTILYITLNIIIEINYHELTSIGKVFVYLCVNVLPMIFSECLFSYLTYKVSYIPTLMIRIPMEIVIYLVPFYPALGDYLTAVLGIIYPFAIYKVINTSINHAEKNDRFVAKSSHRLITYPVMAILVVLIALISGIFRHQLIAIGSNSMKPVYARGDAVLVYKYSKKELDKIKINDILVYNHGGTVITHRVVKKYYSNGHLTFKTKGDNNNTIDDVEIIDDDVRGIVINKVKYIGYPTILLQEFFTREEKE